MLPVIIFEPDDEVRSDLRRYVREYYRDNPSRMSLIADTESLADAVKYLEKEDGITLLMLSIIKEKDESRRGAVQLGRRAMRKNRDNYTLFCLHSAADLEPLLNTGVRPVGVIISPFDKQKLEKVLARIDRDYAEMHEEDEGEFMMLDSGNTSYRVPFSKILYIEALDKKLMVWTDRQSISVRQTLNNLAEVLPGDLFFRCHRSYLINLRHVAQVDYTGMEVTLSSGDAVPLSRSYRDQLRAALSGGKEESP